MKKIAVKNLFNFLCQEVSTNVSDSGQVMKFVKIINVILMIIFHAILPSYH